ncbi:hypothetical protein DMENIID0001_108650 [Sergentomyia squamirostris]
MASVNSVFFSDDEEFSDNFEENKSTIVSAIPISCPDEFLDSHVLLKSWKIKKEIIDVVIAAKLTIWHLRVIEDDDIARLFGANIADCVEFKYYLKKWRSSGGKIVEPPTIQAPSHTVADPLSYQPPAPTITPSHSSFNRTVQEGKPRGKKYSSRDEIENILKMTARGNGILQYYSTHQKLELQHQAWLVDIVSDYYLQKYDSVSMKLMDRISDKIVELFPTEDKTVYYTRRSFKGHPKGKLHDKLKNKRRLYIAQGILKKRRNIPETTNNTT